MTPVVHLPTGLVEEGKLASDNPSPGKRLRQLLTQFETDHVLGRGPSAECLNRSWTNLVEIERRLRAFGERNKTDAVEQALNALHEALACSELLEENGCSPIRGRFLRATGLKIARDYLLDQYPAEVVDAVLESDYLEVGLGERSVGSGWTN